MIKERKKYQSAEKSHIKSDIERQLTDNGAQQQHLNIRQHDRDNQKSKKSIYRAGWIIKIDHIDESKIKNKQNNKNYISNHT